MLHLSEVECLALAQPDEPARPFCHPQAIVESTTIGAGTRIWAFAHVLPNAVIGRDCNLCDHTFVEGDVQIGDRVTVKSGVYLWAGARIEDDVFLGPAVVFSNDKRPRSKRYPAKFESIVVRQGASVGAGAVLLPGIEIGAYAMVGAGAVVTKSVPPHALVFGNPARIQGYVCHCGARLSTNVSDYACDSCKMSGDSIVPQGAAA